MAYSAPSAFAAAGGAGLLASPSGSRLTANRSPAAVKVLEFCASKPEGATTADMLSALKALTQADLVAAINELLAAHALGAHRAADGREVFKATPPGDGARFKGLSAEEVLVYQAVEASGNVGIWTKELRARTNLQQPAVARMLKALETRGLVKSVRSVANGSRKVYMLRGLEPAREVTGGAWYTGHEFDSAFTVALAGAAAALVRRAGPARGASAAEVARQLAAAGLARVALREDDVRTVLDALVCDGVAERVLRKPASSSGNSPSSSAAAAPSVVLVSEEGLRAERERRKRMREEEEEEEEEEEAEEAEEAEGAAAPARRRGRAGAPAAARRQRRGGTTAAAAAAAAAAATTLSSGSETSESEPSSEDEEDRAFIDDEGAESSSDDDEEDESKRGGRGGGRGKSGKQQQPKKKQQRRVVDDDDDGDDGGEKKEEKGERVAPGQQEPQQQMQQQEAPVWVYIEDRAAARLRARGRAPQPPPPPSSSAAAVNGVNGEATASAAAATKATTAAAANSALAASVGGPGQALGALAGLPCGKCPVARECVDGGAVSPQACAYLSRFLDF